MFIDLDGPPDGLLKRIEDKLVKRDIFPTWGLTWPHRDAWVVETRGLGRAGFRTHGMPPAFPVSILHDALRYKIPVVFIGHEPIGMAPAWEDKVRFLPPGASVLDVVSALRDLVGDEA